MTSELFIEVDPLPTPRPRFRRIGKNIQTYYNKGYKDYMKYIKEEFIINSDLNSVFEGSVRLELEFLMPRPKYHYGTGRNSNNIKDKYHTPGYNHIIKPDIDNLSKAIIDSLNGVLYKDDSQVVDLTSKKRYIYVSNENKSKTEKPGVKILWKAMKG